ncbi:MAG: hypothetical protein JNJ52_00490 [Flavobacterium sp.]|nr:hypothetical protein [Flavobacterium sp.]
MKNKNVIVLIIAALTITFSCKNESQIEVFGIKTKKKYLQLEKAKWFLGNWENVTKESVSREVWKQQNDSTLIAESFTTVEKDTVFYEKVNLLERNDSLFYIVSVRNQNKEKPVSFYLTKSTDNQMIFENPKHDFPNKIEYNKVGNDSIFAKIYGTDKGKEVAIDFPMKRSK